MLTLLPPALQPYAKFVVAALGALAQLVSAGLVPAEYTHLAQVILAVATALGVVAQGNGTPLADQPDTDSDTFVPAD